MKMPFQQRKTNENEAERAEEWHRSLSLSTRKTCEALEEFLTSDAIQVLELKGDWGIGKTYYFQNFLTWAKCKNMLGRLSAYSYVSLFGSVSISSLEASIFTSHEPQGEKASDKLASAYKPIKSILDMVGQATIGLHGARFALGTGTALIDGLIRKYYIKDFLICFDDIERMSEQVSPSSFLGLVSSLKEQQNCKIVLIYNYDKLSASNPRLQDAIDEYREKIIDREVSLRPTVEENMAISWPRQMGRPLSFERVFSISECANIRVMRKARWAIEYFSKILGSQWPNIRDSFQLVVASLTVIYYSRKDLFPDPSSVLADDFFKHLAAESQMHRAQYQFISKLGYSPAPHHNMILDFFRHGSVDIDSYKGILRVNDINERLSGFNHQCDEISSRFSSGFFASHDQVVHELHEFLQQHSGDISIGKAYGAIDFLGQCGVEVDPALLNQAIQSHMDREPQLDPFTLNFSNLPDAVREDLQRRYDARGASQSISRLMQSLAGSNGWDSDEIKLLRGRTESEWLEWISSFNSSQETTESGDFYSNVFHLVATFLWRFKSVADAEDQATLQKIKGALEQLRARSPVDKLRVEMLFNYMSENV
jgi:hypothetical protein